MIKGLRAAVLVFLLILTPLAGCVKNDQSETGKITIVCTIFPQYDWVYQILGDRAEDAELTLLLNNRIDLHNYQPSVDDMIKISSCDLFIYVGGESDAWVEDALKNAANRNMIKVNLLQILGDEARLEEVVAGMEEDEEEEEAYDEHIWLSLNNAKVLCAAITDELSSVDARNADEYRSNLAVYMAKLTALDAEYRAVVAGASVKTLLFGDRFPFRYLVEDYGLTYHAAFPGCSAETEASFGTIIFLAEKMDELSLKAVMVTESGDQSIAKTIINNTKDKNQRILVLEAMQSMTADDIRKGRSYLSVMEDNLYVLKDALNIEGGI